MSWKQEDIEETLRPRNLTSVAANIQISTSFHRLRSDWSALVLAALLVSPGFAAESARIVSFRNDVVPVLTKAGCNSGACHAKAGQGQNGFQLSLLGFEPQEDYEHLVKEGRGRRVFAASPDQSTS